MKLVSGIIDSGFFAQSALSAEVATKDSLGRNISETYLTAVDIPESANWNSTYNTVSANSAQWAGGTANPQIPVTSTSGISIFESGDQVYFNVSANYATEDWVTGQGYLTAETDWSDTITAASANAYNEATAAIPTGLATEDWVTAQGYLTTAYNPEFAYHDTAISSIDNSALYDNSAHARINTLAGRISDLSSNKLDTTAFSDVSGTFLTAHQDLSDYQTTAGMTAYQPVGSYLTADALDSVSGDWNEVSAKLDTTAFSDVSATFLTAHQDISNKLDTTAFSDVSGNFLTAVPDTYLQNTDLSTEDGKVTAISGIPLSAGGVVPGYNETVLWEATANNQYSATLSEPYSNFERIRIEFNSNDTLNTDKSLYNEFPGYVTQFNLIGQRTDGGGIVMTLSDLNGSEDKTQLTPSYGRYVIVPKTSTTLTVGSINIVLKSVVGINRKENA